MSFNIAAGSSASFRAPAVNHLKHLLWYHRTTKQTLLNHITHILQEQLLVQCQKHSRFLGWSGAALTNTKQRLTGNASKTVSEGTNTSMHGTEKRRPPLWNGNSSVCSSGVSLWWWILLEAVSFLLWCGGCRQRPYSGPSSGCSHWRTMLCNACETDAVTGNTQRHVKRRVHLLANITVL